MNTASINNTIIQAIISGSYKFVTREKGMEFILKLKDKFVLGKNFEELAKEGKARLWIRGYKITAEEQADGSLGNYAMLELVDMADGTSMIAVTKDETPINLHPQRKRKAARMPNYGHPALRLAKKGTEFERYEDVAEILLNMHNEFPDTTIPNKDRVDLMIYSREKTGGKPKTDKMRLTIKPSGEKFILSLEEKEAPKVKERPALPQSPEEAAPASENQIIGKFTALALMKKKKKK